MIRVIKQEDVTKEDYPLGLVPVEDFTEAVEKLKEALSFGCVHCLDGKKRIDEIFGDLK